MPHTLLVLPIYPKKSVVSVKNNNNEWNFKVTDIVAPANDYEDADPKRLGNLSVIVSSSVIKKTVWI